MSQITKVFSILNTTLPYTGEGGSWAATDGAASAASVPTTSDSPNDPSATTDSLQISCTGRSKSNANYWEWTGTWENLGVPAGATVTAVQLTFDWQCQAYTTGAASTIGPDELRDGAAALLGTFLAGSAYSATSSFAARTGGTLSVPSGQQPSGSTIKIRLNATQATGSSSSAVNTLRWDYVRVTITYTIVQTKTISPAGPSGISETDTALALTTTQSPQTKTIGAPTETDTALALSKAQAPITRNLGAAGETDQALALTYGTVVSETHMDLGAAVETDSALALSKTQGPQTKSIVAASETDQALALSYYVHGPLIVGEGSSDDFNRADGPLGSDWTPWSGLNGTSLLGAAKIVSGQAVPSGTSSRTDGAYRAAYAGGDDQFSEATLTVVPTLSESDWVGLTVRDQDSGHTQYLLIWFANAGAGEYRLYKCVAGSYTWLGPNAYAAGTPSAGDVLRIEARGTSITAKVNGNVVLQTSDGSVSGGSPGFGFYHGSGQSGALDNWRGGELGIVAAAEVDYALPLSYTQAPQAKSIASAVESDTALALSKTQAPQTKSIAPASEVDGALGLTHAQQPQMRSIVAAAEDDTALALTASQGPKPVSIAPAPETDSALPLSHTLGPAKQASITAAAETDAALPLAKTQGPQTHSISSAIETDTAVALAFGSAGLTRVNLTAAQEIDQALPLSVSMGQPHAVTLALATEADSAQQLTVSHGQAQRISISSAAETDIALPLSYSHQQAQEVSIALAAEADTALALSFAQAPIAVSIAPATEIDLAVALSLGGATHVTLTPATEADFAMPLGVTKEPQRVTIEPAEELGLAEVLLVRKELALVPAEEVDGALRLSIKGRQTTKGYASAAVSRAAGGAGVSRSGGASAGVGRLAGGAGVASSGYGSASIERGSGTTEET